MAWADVFPTSVIPSQCLDPVAVNLLQYLPAPAAMLVLAAAQLAAVAGCSTGRGLRQARWPGVAVSGGGRR